MAVFTMAQLKTEITTDPNSLGYAPLLAAHNDQGIANLLNAVGVGAAYSLFRNDVSIHDLIKNIAASEFSTLTALRLQQIQLMFSGASTLDATDTNTRTIFTGTIFAGMTATLSNFAIVAKRQGSRAEVLWGDGVVILDVDVAAARVS